NPGAAHPLIEVGHAHSQRLGRSNLTVRHDDNIPPLMASRSHLSDRVRDLAETSTDEPIATCVGP
ncbi:hypothetical protein, partial [Mesorhizobium sp.]|uniref:hypothetical protein n=1 Tax=Mesorhizobium sp. TaxID=1871066 RepID=UPI00257B0060